MGRIVKTIKIDVDKCSGCRSCEIICSAFHAKPRYSIVNPNRSRIRVFVDEQNDLYIPVIGGSYTEEECASRDTVVIKGAEYGECSFCRFSCPSRELFKDPDTGIPLTCDTCGESATGPLCVQWCETDALTYIHREEKD